MADQPRIALFRAQIREEAIAAVAETLRSGWVGLGPRTAAFEQAFGSYVGGRHCVALTSCTAALQLALHVLDLPEGAEVITTPLTFVAANQVILHERLCPVFADVQPRTGNIDPESVASLLTERTGAVVAMHYGGYPCDLDALHGVLEPLGIPLVEDCAHAAGARYRGARIGSHGDMHAFSFHAVKNLPAGDGGALVVGSSATAARVRRLRWFGIDASTHDRAGTTGYRWEYGVDELGFKMHMNDVTAAIALAQLAVLDEDNARRGEIVARYRGGLGGLDGIELLEAGDDRESSHHLCCVLAERRDALVSHLAARGIDAGVHYTPSYAYDLFGGDPLPGVESFWRRAVSLPLHLGLGDDDVDRVVATIREGW